jgi:hypothetical protein
MHMNFRRGPLAVLVIAAVFLALIPWTVSAGTMSKWSNVDTKAGEKPSVTTDVYRKKRFFRYLVPISPRWRPFAGYHTLNFVLDTHRQWMTFSPALEV